jgi:hypothetical protein
MALRLDSNTQLAVISTEHTLFQSSATPADLIYSAYIDLTNMAAGDRTVIRSYIKLLTAGAQILWIEDILFDVQDTKVWHLPGSPSDLASGFALKLLQTDGTGRNYDWVVFGK